MADGLSPTRRRWDLGEALRGIRESQGKTIDEVSVDLTAQYGTGFSSTKISRLETGSRGANPRDVRDLCVYYGVGQAEQERLVGLAKEVRLENRLQSVRLAYPEYVALEARAKVLRTFEPMFIPGLFQTPEYYSAMFDNLRQAGLDRDTTDEMVRDLAQVRQERKRRLDGPDALIVNAVVDENVLRRRVGSRRVMAEQLSHLLDLASLPNITLRVVPLAVGVYPGCESAGFSMLGLGEAEALRESACYLEGMVGTVWAERASDLVLVADVFAHVESLALGVEQSRELVADIANSLVGS